GSKMKTLSIIKLAETVKTKRNEKKLKQEELANLTGINRAIISRIERQGFVPSISQFEELAKVLEFDITDVFEEKQKNNPYSILRSEALNKNEKEGVDKLFTMMLSLRQQILLRSKHENESINFHK
ncbi:helix-turn-helix transcriptional regulator, partial [Herbivorax sp. ANBcel31]|uniref:helix-turn-helix domain-containing protein n=1 Tax=Herbivorax sp. ANBcel31 TaxID=3069754 RepID=UPI0027B02871